jgi:hypothetical protein
VSATSSAPGISPPRGANAPSEPSTRMARLHQFRSAPVRALGATVIAPCILNNARACLCICVPVTWIRSNATSHASLSTATMWLHNVLWSGIDNMHDINNSCPITYIHYVK